MVCSLSLIIPPTKPVAFRVYCTARKRRPSDPYFEVMIFRDVAIMREFAFQQSCLMYSGKVIGGVRRREDFGANSRRRSYWRHAYGCARWWGEGADGDQRKKQIGVILLARGFLTSRIIAHELAHAAMFFILGSHRPAKFKRADDERLATAAGELQRQFDLHYEKILFAHVKRRRGRRRKKT